MNMRERAREKGHVQRIPPPPHPHPHIPVVIFISLPLSTLFAKRNQHVVIRMKSDCAVRMSIDIDMHVHEYFNNTLALLWGCT